MAKTNEEINYILLANDVLKALNNNDATAGQGITACCYTIAFYMKFVKDKGKGGKLHLVPDECAAMIKEIYEDIKNGPHLTKEIQPEQDGNGEIQHNS